MNDHFQESSWSLNELVGQPIEPSITSLLDEYLLGVERIEGQRDALSNEIPTDKFLEILECYENLGKIGQRLQGYAALFLAENTQNPTALNLRGRISQALTTASNRIVFLMLWFKDLPDNTANRLIEASGPASYFLESHRRFKPYMLSESEEKIINLKDINGIEAVVNLYEMITNHFTFELDIDGEKKALTRDALSANFRHPSAEVRANTYKELNRVYNDNATLLSQIYRHIVLDWSSEAVELRGYSEAIAPRNLANDLPGNVVDIMLEVCRQNTHIFQRYFRLKANWLGLPKLARSDIYAPLSQSNKQFVFEQAVTLVLNSFDQFSAPMADGMRKVIRENHLDSQLRPGKRGGAFCYSALPELTPWVLVNFAGKARDVATLAHEMGHAIHSLQATRLPSLTFRPALPLAETASIFSEMLLTDRLLADETDPTVQRDLLSHAIADAYASIQRQAYFTLFEREAHRMIAEGKSNDDLTQYYMANLGEQFGDSVELTKDFCWEWTSIPHLFRSPFYTYSYTFGQLLVMALYQQYRAQGAQFAPRYLQILAAGGSDSPMNILTKAGLDISAGEFWQGGFDVLAGFVDRLERL